MDKEIDDIAERLDDQEFYELMQQYRHTKTTNQEEVVKAFEAVKDYIKGSEVKNGK